MTHALEKTALEGHAAPGAESLGPAAFVEHHADFVWRSLRRLGVPESQADDGAQEVFIVAMRKLGSIERGRERAYLFGVASHVAAHVRRSFARSREIATEEPPVAHDTSPPPDVALDEQRARALLDRVLDAMPEELRAVFVLHEIEGTTMVEIARGLELPPGTVASRLRRARDIFHDTAARLRASTRGQR